MKTLPLSLLFLFGLLFSSCGDDDKKNDPQPTETGVRIVVTGAKTGTSANARFIMSRKPVRQAAAADQFLSLSVDNSTKSLDAATWDRKDLATQTLYLSLQYQNINAAGFTRPTGTDNIQAQVVIDGKAPVTITLDAAAYQDAANRWTDPDGKVNVVKEVSVSI
jgi:hypothetical protein